MIKKKLCFMLIFSFLLTGCSDVALTQSESGQVSEYIAYSLLKFNNNPDMLTTSTDKKEDEVKDSEKPTVEKLDHTEKVEASAKPVKPSSSEEPEESVTAGEVFGNSSINVTLSSSGLYKSYPADGSDTYFSLSASAGKKLLVLELNIKNTGNKKIKFQTSGSGLSYSLNGSTDKALATLLENDIHFFNTSIKAGKSVKALLVYEVSKDFNIEGSKVTITKDGKSVSFAI